MIADLFSKYYAVHGTNPTYTAIRIITVDSHYVAWMEFTGRTVIGGEESYTGRDLYCQCYFTEGVGWKVEDGKVYRLLDPEDCLYRKAALHLRHLELRREYLKRFKILKGDSFALHRKVEEIILDLIGKVKAGEFVESGSGAAFWGGYFYLQTVADITDQFFGHLWEDVHRMVWDKKIGLEGVVIQPYRKPPPPVWEEFLKIEDEGWVGIAYLPGNRQIARQWKLKVLKPDGKPAYRFLPGLPLIYDPVFGPDISDAGRAQKELLRLIYEARRKN